MTPAQKILEMIENVDPADSAAMDEIDVLVDKYLGYEHYCYVDPLGAGVKFIGRKTSGTNGLVPRYTRSRDALKAIRPEGWDFEMCPVINGRYECVLSQTWSLADTGDYESREVGKYQLPTEELAELHAIIQAIEWERTDGKI